MDFEIRTATPDDLDACARLAAAEDGRPVEAHRDRLASYFAQPDRIHSLVAAVGGPVATVAAPVVAAARVSFFEPPPDAPVNVAPAGWYLIGLVVAPEYRRLGVGLALSAARVRWALARAPEAWYFTGTRNHGSFALHARLGFEEVTRDFWFPRVPFEHGGVLCRVTARSFRPPDR